MKFVEIYKLKNDGTQRVIAVCKMEGNKAVCEGDKIFTENLKKDGVFDYSKDSDKNLFFKDGIKFLSNLKFAFSSGYLNASDIKEE